ncbi:RNA-directed DNA polymerase, eukaryota, reverse transcriptase zinc-binding domain protein [Tanacetum coccineum]
MFKWVWRFYTDGNSLWARFIKAIHGKDERIGKIVSSHQPSAWIDIVNEVNKLKNLDMDLLSLLKKKVGNGVDTLFREEVWKGDTTFKNRYPRVYALELEKLISVADKMGQVDLGSSLRRMPGDGVERMQFFELKTSLEGLQMSNMNDRWTWTMVGMGDFSVASARKYIDDKKLHGPSIITRWVKAVPIKINVMAWKVRFDYLPTRLNLSRRGLELQSILCPICNKEVESTKHLFFACSTVCDLYRKIASWWDICYTGFDSYEEWVVWLLNIKLSSDLRDIFEGVLYTMWWLEYDNNARETLPDE